MLLSLIDARRKRRQLADDSDSGFALIAVIGIMAVTAIIAIALTSSAMSAVSFTTATRASVQARAAADAGIDATWVALTNGTFSCTGSGSTGTGSFTTTTSYFTGAGSALACSGSTVVGTPGKAVVNSKGTAAAAGVAGDSSGNQRSITAVFDIVVNPGSTSLDKIIFSEGDVSLKNNVNLKMDTTSAVPAHLYSNGNVMCGSSGPLIEGSIFLQGDFSAPQNCEVTGTVWAGGGAIFNAQGVIRGDLYSAGGPSSPASPVSMGAGFVGGSVVANGGVSIDTNGNSKSCPLSGYSARVCGSVVSLEGTIDIKNEAKVAGGLYAKGTIDINNVNNTLLVGGNVVSTTGSLLGTANNSGIRVGGYVAVAGSSVLSKSKIGKPASSCSTTFGACVPAHPAIPMAVIPAPLNFPTNTRVVAPPRASMPRIEMYPDSSLAGKWAGWSIEHIPCADVKSKISTGWTGKKLVVVDGCTAPISWDGGAITLRGDLAIMSAAGFKTGNGTSIKSSVAGTKHTMLWIVPSDAKTASGANLVTWSTPIAAQPEYTKPTCASGDYGDIRTDNLAISDTETFIYTPCDMEFSNQVTGFRGQIYAGTTSLPNNSSFVMTAVSVPGVAAQAGAVASVSATQTARFDARDAP